MPLIALECWIRRADEEDDDEVEVEEDVCWVFVRLSHKTNLPALDPAIKTLGSLNATFICSPRTGVWVTCCAYSRSVITETPELVAMARQLGEMLGEAGGGGARSNIRAWKRSFTTMSRPMAREPGSEEEADE